MAVEVLQSQDDLGGVKLGRVLIKRSHLPDVVQQLSSLCITQPKIFTEQQQSGKSLAKKNRQQKYRPFQTHRWLSKHLDLCAYYLHLQSHAGLANTFYGKNKLHPHAGIYTEGAILFTSYHVLLICLKS